MPSAAPSTRMSAGVVVVSVLDRKLKFLLLRAYRNWDFPKGLVEAGESPIDAAVREVREETTLDDISFTAPDRSGEQLTIDGSYVRGQVEDLAKNADLSRFIL